MKYVVVIPDGAADLPLDELDGRTPLEAAQLPHLTELAQRAHVGCAVTTPEGFGAGSDVCSMCLLGYDPRKYHTGRAPLEAAALGLAPGERDWILRVNLVTTGEAGTPDAGKMLDHSAGAITNAEARELVGGLMEYWRAKEPQVTRDMQLHPGVSYRNILVDASGRDYRDVRTTPPHEIPGEPWESHLPQASKRSGEEVAGVLGRLIQLSAEYLPEQPVNRARRAAGKRAATSAWIWGQGQRPAMPPFAQKYGLRGAITTPVDLLAGIAALIGWDKLDVPGATSYHDNDYAGQGQATCRAIGRYDIVCCHVESPDEASHQGDGRTKVAALEAIDREVIGPVVARLEEFGDPEKDPRAEGWRLLVMPDHFTLVSTRKHDPTPVPFLMAGAWVRSAVQRAFSERGAAESDLRIARGDELMEYFLRGGLVGVSKRAPSGTGKLETS